MVNDKNIKKSEISKFFVVLFKTWMISELLRPLTVNVEFTRGGKVLYKATTFIGFVGLITAVKPVSGLFLRKYKSI